MALIFGARTFEMNSGRSVMPDNIIDKIDIQLEKIIIFVYSRIYRLQKKLGKIIYYTLFHHEKTVRKSRMMVLKKLRGETKAKK